MQTVARRNDWPLDKIVLVTEVTKKVPEQLEGPSREGAYVHGLTLEGARWDEKLGALEDSRPKELLCSMPVGTSLCIYLFVNSLGNHASLAPAQVVLVKAVPADKADFRDVYQCPIYATEARFRQEIATAQLRTKQPSNKWTLAGVCLFLDVV